MGAARGFRVSRESASKLLAVLALGLSIVTLGALLALRYYSTMFLGASLTVGCTAYLALRRAEATRGERPFPVLTPISRRRLRLLATSLFFLLMGSTVLLVGANPYYKPLAYYLLTAGSAALLVIQIALLESRRGVAPVLGQVLLLTAVLLGSSQLTFPLGIGGSDAPTHVNLIVVPILQTGRVPGNVPCQFDFDYDAFPSHHLLAATGSTLLGADATGAYYGLAVIGMSLTVLVVFLIAKALFYARIGLLASLLVSVSSYFIFWASHGSALTFAIPLMSLLMLAIVKSRNRTSRRMFLITAIFATALVFTHPYSSMIFGFILVGLVAIERVGRKSRPRPRPALWTTSFFLIALALHWIFYSCQATVALRLAQVYLKIITGEHLVSPPAVYDTLPAATIILNTLGDFLLLTLAVVGFFVVLSRDDRFARTVVLGPTITLFVLAGIGIVTRLPYLLPNRVYVLLQFLGLAPLAAVAIGRTVFGKPKGTSGAPPRTANIRRVLGAALVVASLTFMSSASTVAGFETSLFVGGTPYEKVYDTQYERISAAWLCDRMGVGHRVEVSLSLSPFETRELKRCLLAQNGTFDDMRISEDGSIEFQRFLPGTIVLFSAYDRSPGVLFTTTGVGKPGTGVYVRVNENSVSHLSELDKVYDNGPVQIFFAPG